MTFLESFKCRITSKMSGTHLPKGRAERYLVTEVVILLKENMVYILLRQLMILFENNFHQGRSSCTQSNRKKKPNKQTKEPALRLRHLRLLWIEVLVPGQLIFLFIYLTNSMSISVFLITNCVDSTVPWTLNWRKVRCMTRVSNREQCTDIIPLTARLSTKERVKTSYILSHCTPSLYPTVLCYTRRGSWTGEWKNNDFHAQLVLGVKKEQHRAVWESSMLAAR